jgi:hypothetical protein
LLKEQASFRQEHQALRRDLVGQHQAYLVGQSFVFDTLRSTNTRMASLESEIKNIHTSLTTKDLTNLDQHSSGRSSYQGMTDLTPDMRTAAWFMQHAFIRSIQGWKASFGFWNLLSTREPQFSACFTGNVDKLRILFNTRRASPFDRCTGGFSFLHVRLINFIIATRGCSVDLAPHSLRSSITIPSKTTREDLSPFSSSIKALI